MAVKISELSRINTVSKYSDLLPIVDFDEGITKNINILELLRACDIDEYIIGVETVKTNFKANAGAGGRTILAITSCHTDGGDDTHSSIILIRCGYSGNHVTPYKIFATNDTYAMPEFGISDDGFITITNNSVGRWCLKLIATPNVN